MFTTELFTTEFDTEFFQCPLCLELPTGTPIITTCNPFEVLNGVAVLLPGPVAQHMSCLRCFDLYRAQQAEAPVHPGVHVCGECRGSVESFQESPYLERLIRAIRFTCLFCGARMDRDETEIHGQVCPRAPEPVPVLPIVPAVVPQPPALPAVLPAPPARQVVYISDDEDDLDAMDVDRDHDDVELYNEILYPCACIAADVSVPRPNRPYSNTFLAQGIVWGANFRPATNEAEVGRRLSRVIRNDNFQPIWLAPALINSVRNCKIILAYNALDNDTEFVLASIVEGGRRDHYSGFETRIGQDGELDLLQWIRIVDADGINNRNNRVWVAALSIVEQEATVLRDIARFLPISLRLFCRLLRGAIGNPHAHVFHQNMLTCDIE